MQLSLSGALPVQDASLGIRRAKSLRKKMNDVDTFATARGLPEDLRTALANYFNDAWMAHEGMLHHTGSSTDIPCLISMSNTTAVVCRRGHATDGHATMTLRDVALVAILSTLSHQSLAMGMTGHRWCSRDSTRLFAPKKLHSKGSIYMVADGVRVRTSVQRYMRESC